MLGRPFKVTYPRVREERISEKGTLEETTKSIALAKAREVSRRCPNSLVLAADTLVGTNGDIFGKPRDLQEASSTLKRLRGRTHRVATGLAIVDGLSGRCKTISTTSEVTMRRYSDEDIRAYVVSGEPMDKAGAYAVQDLSFRPARRVVGCYLNVVGLPLCSLAGTLSEFGLDLAENVSRLAPGDCRVCKAWVEKET